MNPKSLDRGSIAILELLTFRGSMNFRQIIARLKAGRNTTRKKLNILMKEGLVKEGNHGKWKKGTEKIFLATKKGEDCLFQEYTDDLNVVINKIRGILERIQEKHTPIQRYRDSASEIINKSIDENKPYDLPEFAPKESESGEWPYYIDRWEKFRTTQRNVFGPLGDSFRRVLELVLASFSVCDDELRDRVIRALENELTVCIELASEKIRIELNLANGSAEILDEFPNSPR